MRLLSTLSLSLCAAFALLGPRAAAAQPEVEPWRAPDPPVVASPRTATSSLEATKPVATPTQQRQAHALTMAIFARPGAAARATARVDAANQPDLSGGQPKIDWNADKGGVGMGGKGVEYRTPF